MPPWLLVDTQPDTLDAGVTRDTPVTCVTRDTRMPMGTGKENDAPGGSAALSRALPAEGAPATSPKKRMRGQKSVCCAYGVEVLPAGIVPTDIFTPTNQVSTVAIIPMQQRKPFLVDSMRICCTTAVAPTRFLRSRLCSDPAAQ